MYRGYQIKVAGSLVEIWYRDELIDTTTSALRAEEMIDDWLNAK